MLIVSFPPENVALTATVRQFNHTQSGTWLVQLGIHIAG